MKLPLHIESKAEFYCQRIRERINHETKYRNVVTIKIPRIKQYLGTLKV